MLLSGVTFALFFSNIEYVVPVVYTWCDPVFNADTNVPVFWRYSQRTFPLTPHPSLSLPLLYLASLFSSLSFFIYNSKPNGSKKSWITHHTAAVITYATKFIVSLQNQKETRK
jgi:hypothetical protein